MSLINTLNNGVLGIQRGLADAQRSASTIASANSMTTDHAVDFAEPFVDLMLARTQVKASAQVVKTTDEMLGTIIDVLA
ncbi:MAG TPA: hypothetical protein VIH66_03870 [Gammaproteobacteria bacterium]